MEIQKRVSYTTENGNNFNVHLSVSFVHDDEQYSVDDYEIEEITGDEDPSHDERSEIEDNIGEIIDGINWVKEYRKRQYD